MSKIYLCEDINQFYLLGQLDKVHSVLAEVKSLEKSKLYLFK